MAPARVDPGGLAAARLEIERIDRSIACLVAARLEAAARAMRLRTAHGEGVTDRRQERRVIERGRLWATELGIPAPLLDELFRALIALGKARFTGEAEPPARSGVTGLLPAPGPMSARPGEGPNEAVSAVVSPR